MRASLDTTESPADVVVERALVHDAVYNLEDSWTETIPTISDNISRQNLMVERDRKLVIIKKKDEKIRLKIFPQLKCGSSNDKKIRLKITNKGKYKYTIKEN